MGSLLIVEVKPTRQLPRARVAAAVEAEVGPFAQERLDEALGLAVCAGRVRARSMVAQGQTPAGRAEAVRAISRAVVGEQRLDGDAVAGEPLAGAACERCTGAPALVGQDLHVGQSRKVIDSHVDELPAGALALPCATPRDAMSRASEASQLLDVEVEQIAGLPPLVTVGGLRRLQRRHRADSVSGEDSTDRRDRHAELLGDELGWQAKAAHEQQQPAPFGREGVGPAVSTARTVSKPVDSSLLETAKPLVRCALADTCRRSRLRHGPSAAAHALDQASSTTRRGPGILMNVHPGFSQVVGGVAPTSFSGLVRMNNPHRNHN